MTDRNDNLRKAAILLSCLDTDTADRLLDVMGDDEARRVRDQLIVLDDVSASERQAVINEFMRNGPIGGFDWAPAAGSNDSPHGKIMAAPSEHLLLETPPSTGYAATDEYDVSPPARPWSDDLRRGATAAATRSGVPPVNDADEYTINDDKSGAAPFRFLDGADGEHLPGLLDGEHPQTVALVLSHLPAPRALDVLRGLSPATQADVLRRLIDLDEADPETLREVERGLESRISRETRRRERRNTGLALVSGILHQADADEEHEILGNLASYAPALAAMFDDRFASLDELTDLPGQMLAEVVATLEPQVVVLALLGMTSEFAERVLSALPRSVARAIRRDMTRLGPVRLDDVETAQHEMLAAARRHCRRTARPLNDVPSPQAEHSPLRMKSAA
ncbi:MAG: hypothetical protein KDA63_03610 [Planctomycetales bacterium]|nr:hypothetical protein [Planctomycetales bacterium]